MNGTTRPGGTPQSSLARARHSGLLALPWAKCYHRAHASHPRPSCSPEFLSDEERAANAVICACVRIAAVCFTTAVLAIALMK